MLALAAGPLYHTTILLITIYVVIISNGGTLELVYSYLYKLGPVPVPLLRLPADIHQAADCCRFR